jgi:hypothetical protein
MSGDAQQGSNRVEWDQKALDNLQTYLTRVENGEAVDLTANRRLIDDALRRMRPDNTRLNVRDLVSGYRAHRGRYILLLEERGEGEGRPFRWIAKLVAMEGTGDGPEGSLTDEQKDRRKKEAEHRCGIHTEGCAWTAHISHHDPVLLPVRVVPPKCTKPEDALGVLYADGSQFIGVERVVFLEEAFNEAVLFGNPKPTSVLLALREVYDRLGIRLYRINGPRDPHVPNFTLRVPRLATSLDAWAKPDNRHLEQVRRDANSAVKQLGFRDPVDALNFITRHVPTHRDEGDSPAPTPPTSPLPAHLLVPVMLAGLAHGDMHARNVLVGLWQHEARWPVVYDYEHMKEGLLIGWDFVKMETELKIRLYPKLFSEYRKGRFPFFQKVQEFETALADATERHAKDDHWPDVADAKTPEARLFAMLLGLRRLAGRYLGSEWVPGYHFLLACYGVWTGRFNKHYYELASAYTAAGVAMARFLWDREKDIIRSTLGKATEPPLDLPEAWSPTHHSPLEFARKWAKSPARQADAESLLRRLVVLYPHVREARAELAALLANQPDKEQEMMELLGIENLDAPGEESWQCDEETAARVGKVFKKKGDAALKKSGPAAALAEYQLAFRWYEYGWRISDGHYSSANAATLLLWMAELKKLHKVGNERLDLERMAEIAARVLQRRPAWLAALGEEDRHIWHHASEGEFRLLLKDWASGGNAYLKALASDRCQPTHRRIILEQAVRLLQAWESLGESPSGLPADFMQHLGEFGYRRSWWASMVAWVSWR